MTTDLRRDDVRLAVRGSAANYLAALLQAAIFIFHTAAARLFGRSAYGAYIFAWSTIEIGNKIALCGLDKGAMRAVATSRARRDPEGERQSIGTALRGVALAGAVVFAGILVLARPIADVWGAAGYAPVLRALAPLVWLWTGMMVLVTATMATRTMRYNLLVRGLADPLFMIAAIGLYALLWRSGGGLAIATAHATAAVGTFAVACYAVHRVFGLGRVVSAAVRTPVEWSLISFSVPVGLAEVFNQAIYRADVLVVAMVLKDAGQVASYGACLLLAETVSSIRYAFDPIFSPLVAETTVSGDRARLAGNLQTLVRWVTLVTVPVFLAIAVFGDQLLTLWGSGYREAFPALTVLAVAHLVNAILGLHQWAVVMSGHSRLDLLNNAIAFVVALALALLLVPRAGLVGAAVATLAANVVFRLLQAIETWYLLHVHALSRAWLKVCVAAGVSAAVQVGVRTLAPLHGWAALGIGTLAGLACYNAALFGLGLAAEEWQVLGRLLGRRSS